jgi:hypothetical protein
MRVLAQPVRMQLIDVLERDGEASVGQLAEAVGISCRAVVRAQRVEAGDDLRGLDASVEVRDCAAPAPRCARTIAQARMSTAARTPPALPPLALPPLALPPLALEMLQSAQVRRLTVPVSSSSLAICLCLPLSKLKSDIAQRLPPAPMLASTSCLVPVKRAFT